MQQTRQEQKRQSFTFLARARCYVLAWSCRRQLSLLSVYTALLFCGVVLGVLGWALFGSRVDGQAFAQSYCSSRAFSSYAAPRVYLRSFVQWFFFYEKYFLALMLCGFCCFGEYLAGAVLLWQGFLLGYSSVALCGAQFSMFSVLLALGRCVLVFLVLVFCLKAMCFLRCWRSRLGTGAPFPTTATAAFFAEFFLFSAALCVCLLLASVAVTILP